MPWTHERGAMFDGSQDGKLGKWTIATTTAAESYKNMKRGGKRDVKDTRW